MDVGPDEGGSLVGALDHGLEHRLLVHLRPGAHRQLRDLDRLLIKHCHLTVDDVARRVHLLYRTTEVLERRKLCGRSKQFLHLPVSSFTSLCYVLFAKHKITTPLIYLITLEPTSSN